MEQKMITIPFDVELAKKIQAGEYPGKIMTKDGRSVRIVCFDAFNACPLVVLINDGKQEYGAMYNKKGIIPWTDESDYGENLVIQVHRQEPECNFEPFEKVLVRNSKKDVWFCNIFSHLSFNNLDFYPFKCIDCGYKHCIPYNEQTKHLLGTTNNWEE